MPDPILKKVIVGKGTAAPVLQPKAKKLIFGHGGLQTIFPPTLKKTVVGQGAATPPFPPKLKKFILAQGQEVTAPTTAIAWKRYATPIDFNKNGFAAIHVNVPATVLPNITYIEVWLQEDGAAANYYAYRFTNLIAGVNVLVFNPLDPDSTTTLAPDLSQIDRVQINIELTADSDGLNFDNFRWIPGFEVEGGTTNMTVVEEDDDPSRVFQGTQALRMNKITGYDFAGIARLLDEPINLTTLPDLLEVSFFLEAEDVPKVDYFRVVLDETPLWARKLLIDDWSYRYDGQVLPASGDGWNLVQNGDTSVSIFGSPGYLLYIDTAPYGGGAVYHENQTFFNRDDSVWIYFSPVGTPGGPSQTYGFQVVHNNLIFNIRFDINAVLLPDGTDGLTSHAYTPALRDEFIFYFNGATNELSTWLNGTLISTTTTTVTGAGEWLRVGKIDNTGAIESFGVQQLKVYRDSTNQRIPYSHDYVAARTVQDFTPFGATPVWTRVGSTPSRWTTPASPGGYLEVNNNSLSLYHVEIDPKVDGGWSATEDSLIIFRAWVGANSASLAWGIQFEIDLQEISFYLSQPAGISQLGFGASGAEVFYTGWDVTVERDYRIIVRWADGEADLYAGDLSLGTWTFIATQPLGVSAQTARMRFGKYNINDSGGASLFVRNVYWQSIPREISSSYDSTFTPKLGWNTFQFDQNDPTSTVGSPTRTDIERYAFRVYTNNPTDIFSSPIVDGFRVSPNIYLAKNDFYASDGTRHWLGKVMSYGTLSKSLNENIGNYSISDMSIALENVSGYFSAIYEEYGIGLKNTEVNIRYGFRDDIFDNFFDMFNGVVNMATFPGYGFNIEMSDPMQGLFNRLPNQFVTRDSWPEVPDDVKNYVAPIILGHVEAPLGALPVIPVGFEIEVEAGVNDKIDFDLRPKDALDNFVTDTASRYTATLTPGTYTDRPAFAAMVQTQMNLAMGSPPLPQHFEVTFEEDKKKFQIKKILGSNFQILWNAGANAETSARFILGWPTDQDLDGSSKYVAEVEAWNQFVIARHVCRQNSRAKVWIKEEFKGDKDTDGIDFDFDHTTADGLKWTTLTLPKTVVGREEIAVNISGMTDTGTEAGTVVENPVTALKLVLIRFAEFPAELINDDGFTAQALIADQKILRVAGAQIEDVEWDTFMEGYCKDFRLDLFANNEGKLTPAFFVPEILDQTAPALTDILDIKRDSFDYDPNFDSIANRIRYEFRYDYVRDKFLKADVAQDDESIALAGREFDWPEGTLQFNWVRETVVARRAVATTLNLFSEAMPVVKLGLSYNEWDIDLTDKKNISHVAGPAVDSAGNRSYNNRLHRVIGVQYNIDDFTVDVTFQDMFRLSERCFFLGDRDFPAAELNWLSASATNRILYGYLCNRNSGKFTDGEPGKKLC